MNIFTAIFGGYDDVHNADVTLYYEGIDPLQTNAFSPLFRGKRYKMGHGLLADKDSLWIDGNIELTDREGLEYYLEDLDADIAFLHHPSGGTVHDELRTVLNYKMITPDERKRVEEYYKEIGFDSSAPRVAGCFVYCKQPKKIQPLLDMWFNLCVRHIHRDQLMLPVVLQEFSDQFDIMVIEDIDIYKNKFFKVHPHKEH